jgi:pyruvate,orthophosphate dikinase
VEQVREGLVEKGEALARLEGLDLAGITRRRLSLTDVRQLCQGQAAGIGVAIGPLVLDGAAVARFSEEQNRAAVLVRNEITTADIAAIARSSGVLTARGNRTSHAAVVARQLGKPCITGCSGLRIDQVRRVVDFGERALPEGSLITLDSNTGRVFAGAGEIVSEYPTEWLDEIRSWR